MKTKDTSPCYILFGNGPVSAITGLKWLRYLRSAYKDRPRVTSADFQSIVEYIEPVRQMLVAGLKRANGRTS